MGAPNIRDILTAFSPSLDYFAICSGDGRIKVWDAVKGQLQTEFVDIEPTETTDFFNKPGRGHLSMDYKCMKWLSLGNKKKRKLGTSLLVLGTGGGDVLALDVSAGQLKWRASDCHPGGVNAVSFPKHGSCIYTAGVDGMVCELDSMSGNLLRKFKASSKPISSMSVSPDGKLIATAAAQLKIFNSSNHKKLQKFSGHPAAVRCISFSEDGKSVLSSSVGERYIAVWKIDGSKKQMACCSLAMDHPAVLLESRYTDPQNTDETGVSVLSVSEVGACYFWHAKSIEEFHNSKPTKICIVSDDKIPKKYKDSVPNIFGAKLQTVVEPASGHVFLAYGLPVKPLFEKVIVQSGKDLKLNSSLSGILLPISQSLKSKKSVDSQNRVTALDRANAEDAILPVPKIFDLVDERIGVKPIVSQDVVDKTGVDAATVCMEDHLRSLGLLSPSENATSTQTFDPTILKGINLDSSVPQKKMKEAVLSLTPSEAYSLLKGLVSAWQSRSCDGKFALPWICCILVNHNDYIVSQEPITQLLDSLRKLTKSKAGAVQSLYQLSGRLQLVMAQIDKASNNKVQSITHDEEMDDSEDDDVEEVLYGVDEDSQSGTEDDD